MSLSGIVVVDDGEASPESLDCVFMRHSRRTTSAAGTRIRTPIRKERNWPVRIMVRMLFSLQCQRSASMGTVKAGSTGAKAGSAPIVSLPRSKLTTPRLWRHSRHSGARPHHQAVDGCHGNPLGRIAVAAAVLGLAIVDKEIASLTGAHRYRPSFRCLPDLMSRVHVRSVRAIPNSTDRNNGSVEFVASIASALPSSQVTIAARSFSASVMGAFQ